MAKHFFIQEIASNRKATYDYHVIDTIEAGIQLTGNEVKSIKKGLITLSGSYAVIKNNEAFLINATISPYQPNNLSSIYNPSRTRKLLLKKQEIVNLNYRIKKEKLTLIPLKIYNKNGLIKIEIALARGKKKYDKRESLKQKEIKKKIEQSKKLY